MNNPFIYVTDKDSDFEGDEGRKLKQYFTKVFYSQYKKYRAAVESAINPEAVKHKEMRTHMLERWIKSEK